MNVYLYLGIYLFLAIGPFACTFERDMCSWTQPTSDVFDWQRQATRDPTTSSGPTVDHSGSKLVI